ncbi:DUF2785 domain-containing protein [Kitasatospora sp. RB6PN24]|uniref:DUF2785 domain-containing protein n=1 Tax=Kitasatospora humi TaxID=2893891 RepID=UPI001E560BD0|nr:DUF2785 domain-containing protein [Kitasatospora humi]MCC9307145.1 DUF2785 domain-containing protein [Kitasatospora humi]
MSYAPIDWALLAATGFPFPADVPAAELLDELAAMLSSPDPVVRDDHAYTASAQWVREGRLDDQLVALGEAAVARLDHPEVQARTFAPLVLRCVLTRSRQLPGAIDQGTVQRWYAAFARWYPAEPDTRGWDDRLGWLHAVAHGADAAAAFARALPEQRADLLDLCARRIAAADADHRYLQMEDARLARAITGILLEPGLTEAEATGWLDVPAKALEGGGPGPVPAWAFNIFATLQALQVHLTRGLADGGVPPHAEAVAGRALELLRLPCPWLA